MAIISSRQIIFYTYRCSYLLGKRTPFSIRFLSDNYEFENEANKAGMMRGFELQYNLQDC